MAPFRQVAPCYQQRHHHVDYCGRDGSVHLQELTEDYQDQELGQWTLLPMETYVIMVSAGM
jgi:hypothetical protein